MSRLANQVLENIYSDLKKNIYIYIIHSKQAEVSQIQFKCIKSGQN